MGRRLGVKRQKDFLREEIGILVDELLVKPNLLPLCMFLVYICDYKNSI